MLARQTNEALFVWLAFILAWYIDSKEAFSLGYSLVSLTLTRPHVNRETYTARVVLHDD